MSMTCRHITAPARPWRCDDRRQALDRFKPHDKSFQVDLIREL